MANPGLITISKSAWKASKAGKRGASWSDFVTSYLAHHGVPVGGATNGSAGGMFTPLTPQQETAAAQGLVTPIVRSATADINNSFNTQQRLGNQAVTGYTKALATDMNRIAPEVQAGYANAGSTIGSAYDSLQGATTADGKQALAQLAAKENAIGAHDPSLLNAAGLYGTAAGNIGAARAGSIADLAMRGAGAGAVASAMPGVAALAGARNMRVVNESTALGRRSALQDLAGKVPQMTSQALSQIQQNEVNKAVANATASYHQGLLDNSSALVPYSQAQKLSGATGDVVTVDPKTGTVTDTGKVKPGKGGTHGVSAASRLSNDRQVQNGAVTVAATMHKTRSGYNPAAAQVYKELGIPYDSGQKPVGVAFKAVISYYHLHGYRNAAKSVLWTNAFDALSAAGYDPTGLPEYKQLVAAQNAAAKHVKKK